MSDHPPDMQCADPNCRRCWGESLTAPESTDPEWLDNCAFCDLPQWDEHLVEVLNIEPLDPVAKGHRLFIPRPHIERADSDPAWTGIVFTAATNWAAVQGGDFNLIINAGRAATQSVDHLHVHYVPRVEGDGLTLPWTRQKRATR